MLFITHVEHFETPKKNNFLKIRQRIFQKEIFVTIFFRRIRESFLGALNLSYEFKKFFYACLQ